MSNTTFHEYSQRLMDVIDQIVMIGDAVLLDHRIDPRSLKRPRTPPRTA